MYSIATKGRGEEERVELLPIIRKKETGDISHTNLIGKGKDKVYPNDLYICNSYFIITLACYSWS